MSAIQPSWLNLATHSNFYYRISKLLRIKQWELLTTSVILFLFIFTGFSLSINEWPSQVANRFFLTNTIKPDHPRIEQLNNEFQQSFDAELERRKSISSIGNNIEKEKLELIWLEQFIINKIRYVSDVENYKAFDHYPNIQQALQDGDDCDGRAIIACSLLIHRGFLDSYVIINQNHAWIEVYLSDGSLMEILTLSTNIDGKTWFIKWNDSKIKILWPSFLWALLLNYVCMMIIIKLLSIEIMLLLMLMDLNQPNPQKIQIQIRN